MASTIKQKTVFNIPSNKLFKFYTDENLHSEIIGKKTKITKTAGDNFSMYGGQIKGKNLLVKNNKMIVQAWRYKNWDKSNLDSIATLTFTDNEDGTTLLELSQSNVPDDHADAVKDGWKTYWKTWKSYIKSAEK